MNLGLAFSSFWQIAKFAIICKLFIHMQKGNVRVHVGTMKSWLSEPLGSQVMIKVFG